MKISALLLVIFVGACATPYSEFTQPDDMKIHIGHADKLARSCLIQIDEPSDCGLASCQWSASFERCFGGESPIEDVILQRRSFSKASCIAFDDALQPALSHLNRCSNDSALASEPKLEGFCRDYLQSLTSSCAGYTGYVLGIRDAQLSEEYRKEMASEAPDSDVLERIESRLVRYRPDKQ